MPVGNAWKYAPARQARLQADMQNPEYIRRREMYRAARSEKKGRVARWNAHWNTCGRHPNFPDFPEWDSFSPKQQDLLCLTGRRSYTKFEKALKDIRAALAGGHQ